MVSGLNLGRKDKNI